MNEFDTICALATPPGTGGLAVVRLSGNDAFHIADACFSGKNTLTQVSSHTIHYGKFLSGKHELDIVTASVFVSPHSYTGENVVEFGCHGGERVSAEIVKTLIEAGARHAGPGEFTKRAFLNRKLDLTQVEAVADIIHSGSIQGIHASARQLSGGFTAKIGTLRQELLETCGLLELELDFAEEDIRFVDRDGIRKRIDDARRYCLELVQSFSAAEILRSGYSVGIVGFPNAGKSSLLNALLQKNRAIVSNVPGTTRDYVDETVVLNGINVRLIDTAGLRETDDVIEIEGIRFAEEVLRECHMLLLVNDSTESLDHSHQLFVSLQKAYKEATIVPVQTKVDALPDDIAKQLNADENVRTVSSVTAVGVSALKEYIGSQANQDQQRVVDFLINSRHAALLHDIANHLGAAISSLDDDVSNEFVAVDVRLALRLIGEITGDEWSEDVLEEVFSRFCIGK